MNLSHTCIRASAGSGKTFQLAHRYISLLAQNVPAERIMAMTFSRAAAGEIFDSIIEYLAKGAASPAGAKERNQHLSGDPLTQNDYLILLRNLLQSMHRLHIGTLDSFMVGILKTFPMEMGIAPQFNVMDEKSYEAQQARQDVLNSIFHNPSITTNERDDFLRAFSQSTFGVEEKNLHKTLHRFIDENQTRWAELPDAQAWGNTQRIFPNGSPWLTPPDDPTPAVQTLQQWLENAELPTSVIDTLMDFAYFAGTFDSQSAWKCKALTRVPLKSFAEDLPLLLNGDWSFTFRKKEYHIDGNGAKALLTLLHHCMYLLLTRALTQTQGLGHLLNHYDKLYDQQIRRAGKLSFTDVQHLLHPLRPTRKNETNGRIYIDYRLDAKLDHWLWDEFQDTSDLQWDILSGLIDEAIQDPEERRSVFYVGDTKQAIYGWRGGNPKLFQHLLDQYPQRFEQKRLHESRRTPPAILHVVNTVFTNLHAFDFPPNTLTRWNPFPLHKSAVTSHQGYLAIIEPPCPDKTHKPTTQDRYEVCAQLLRELKLDNSGLNVGILTRSNKVATELADYLRATNINLPIAHEGQTMLADNAIVALILSLLQLAAHPGDRFAYQHLMMSPLKKAIEPTLPTQLLTTIQNTGFHGLIKKWTQKLDPSSLSTFERQRLHQLKDCALTYDTTGSRDTNAFIDVIRNTHVAATTSECPIRIMTVHKSKGLGFDIVILPELVTTKSMSRPSIPETIKSHDCMLRMPPKMVQDLDPTLSQISANAQADQAFEAICTLYVAMTRSKQALYCITSYLGATSKTQSPAYILKNILCPDDPNPFTKDLPYTTLYEYGDLNELQKIQKKQPNNPTPKPSAWNLTTTPQDHHLPSPSQIDRAPESVAALLGSTRQTLDFGTAVHSLFEEIQWLDQTNIDDLIKTWTAAYNAEPPLIQKTIAHVQKTITSSAVQNLLAKPTTPCTIWNEKEFNLLIDGKTLNGVIDRVHLHGEKNNYTHAEIIDYKTNQVQTPQEIQKATNHYRPQLQAYAQVLHTLTNIPIDAIELKLLFTRPAEITTL